MKLYVDDLNQAGHCLKFGTKYRNGRLYIPGEGWRGRSHKGHRMDKEVKIEIEREAEQESTSQHSQTERERQSANIYKMIANEIRPNSIKMVEDIPGNHLSGMVPILDTTMAIVDCVIVHHHYSKPMASLELVSARSAMSMSSKISILVQEACRRVKNYSVFLPWNQKVAEVNKLICQMLWSGYSEKIREVVARRALAKLESDWDNFTSLGRPLYRTREERKQIQKPNK